MTVFSCPAHHRVQVVERAFTTLVNIMHRSDANRGLAEECGTIGPTLTIMDTVDNEGVLVQARRERFTAAVVNVWPLLFLFEFESGVSLGMSEPPPPMDDLYDV